RWERGERVHSPPSEWWGNSWRPCRVALRVPCSRVFLEPGTVSAIEADTSITFSSRAGIVMVVHSPTACATRAGPGSGTGATVAVLTPSLAGNADPASPLGVRKPAPLSLLAAPADRSTERNRSAAAWAWSFSPTLGTYG